jgi:plastocyanin
MRMRRLAGVVAVFVLLTASCGGGNAERVVQVDYRNDEFPSHYWRFFPSSVDAHPGDTVVFRQQWTGEPHTVTLGTNVDESLPKIEALEKKYAKYGDEPPPEIARVAEKEFMEVTKGIPSFDPYKDAAAQNAEQPCYLSSGSPSTDPNTPCPKAAQRQPEFNGRQTYYSSGFIAPSGANGNSYRVKLSSDIDSGTYHYYCVVHFPMMQGEVVVKPKGARVASQKAVDRRALAEINTLSVPLRKAFTEVKSGTVRTAGMTLRAPVAGYHSGEEFSVAIDAFAPRTVTAKAGRPVTWNIVGAHTVSFGVPRYFPIYFVDKDGTVRRNPQVDKPAGGSPAAPPVDFLHPTYRIDGGTYGGTGFYSSGLLGSEPFSTYTLRFAKPGRYRYACLVHPAMVGFVVVEA